MLDNTCDHNNTSKLSVKSQTFKHKYDRIRQIHSMSFLRQTWYSAIRNMILSFPAPLLISSYLADNQTIKPVHIPQLKRPSTFTEMATVDKKVKWIPVTITKLANEVINISCDTCIRKLWTVRRIIRDSRFNNCNSRFKILKFEIRN